MHFALVAVLSVLPLSLVSVQAQDAGNRPGEVEGTIASRAKTSVRDTDKDANQADLLRRNASIRIDTTLVQIPVTVTDPLNRFVTGLEKEHFKLFEDKIEQTIAEFSSEDAPLSVVFAFDTSRSMGSKLRKSRQAAVRFFEAANPEDEFCLIEFSDRPD